MAGSFSILVQGDAKIFDLFSHALFNVSIGRGDGVEISLVKYIDGTWKESGTMQGAWHRRNTTFQELVERYEDG